MIVYLVRHTDVSNKQNLCYGQSEIDLAGTFAQEALAITSKLPSEIDRCYTSPLRRCMQLAEQLFDKPIITDAALMELNFGDWEMRPWDSIAKDDIGHWSADFVNIPCPGGESFAQLNDRVLGFWNDLLKSKTHGNVLVVTHGGVIRSIVTHIQGTSLNEAFNLSVKPGCIVRIDALRQSYTFLSG